MDSPDCSILSCLLSLSHAHTDTHFSIVESASSCYLPTVIILSNMKAMFRLMGAAALQKYIGSLGGIGTSGVGSSSSYAPKELNKEVMPEKASISISLLAV